MAYFYILFLLLHAFLYLMGMGNHPAGSAAPDWQALFNRRMILGTVLLGLAYPLIGFKKVKLPLPEGGPAAHAQGLRDAAQLCGFRPAQAGDDGELRFVADSPMRRLLAVYEDEVVVAFEDAATITVAGLRKDVARMELRVKDYVQDLKRRQAC